MNLNLKLNGIDTSKIAVTVTMLVLLTAMGVILSTCVIIGEAFTIKMNLTDARYNATSIPAMYEYLIQYYHNVTAKLEPEYFTKNQEFTLYIINSSNIYKKAAATWEAVDATDLTKYGISLVTIEGITYAYLKATVKTDSKGLAKFEIGLPPGEEWVNYTAYWTIIITLHRFGKEWVVLNYTTAYMYPLGILIDNLTKIGTGEASIYVLRTPSLLTAAMTAAGETNDLKPETTLCPATNVPPAYPPMRLYDCIWRNVNPTPAVWKAGRLFARDLARGLYMYAEGHWIQLPYLQWFTPAVGIHVLESTWSGNINATAFVRPYPDVKMTISVYYSDELLGYIVEKSEYNDTLTERLTVKPYALLNAKGNVPANLIDREPRYFVYGPYSYTTALLNDEKPFEVQKDEYGAALPRLRDFSDIEVKITVTFGPADIVLYEVDHVPLGIYIDGYYLNGTISTMSWYNDTTKSPYWGANYSIAGISAVGAAASFTYTKDGIKYYLNPVPVLAIPLVIVNIYEVRDVLGNLIWLNDIYQPYVLNGLYFKYGYEVGGKFYPTIEGAGVYGLIGYLPVGRLEDSYEFGETGITYTSLTEEFPPKVLIEYAYEEGGAYYTVTTITLPKDMIDTLITYLKSATVRYPLVEIRNVTVALVPVLINITEYSELYPVTQQEAVPRQYAGELRVDLLYSVVSARGPWAKVAEGKVIMVYDYTTGKKYTFAIFTPEYALGTTTFEWVTQVKQIVSYLPAPALNGTDCEPDIIGGKYVCNATYLDKPANKTEITAYYMFKVYYEDSVVGVGEFAIRYYINKTLTGYYYSPFLAVTDNGLYISPSLDVVAKWKLLQDIYEEDPDEYEDVKDYIEHWYFNGTSVITIAGSMDTYKSIFTVAIGIIIGRLNIHLVNLCNETISEYVGVTATIEVIRVGTGRVGEYPIGGGYLAIPVPVTVEFNETGLPVAKGIEEVEYEFRLHYFGYELPAVDPETREPTTYTLEFGKVTEVVFPLINVNFKVLSETKEPLIGFVVSVWSTVTGDEMWRAISNESGMVYVKNVPIAPYGDVKITVRTIVPEEDRDWFRDHLYVNRTLADYEQNYAEYVHWLKLDAYYGVTKADVIDAYTLGTRGPIDVNLVVYVNESYTIPKDTACYEVFNLITDVGYLRVIVVDKDFNVLTSVPVYPCTTPSFCPPFYYNTTVVITDYTLLHGNASKWIITPARLVENATVFAVVASTWMKPVYEGLANRFLKLALEAKSYADDSWSKGWEVNWYRNYTFYLANYSFYVLASMLAGMATDTPYANFTIPSVARGPYVHLFMPGQRLHVKVFHIGYEVFNSLLQVPTKDKVAIVYPEGYEVLNDTAKIKIAGEEVEVKPGTIIIVADVQPVTFIVTDKSITYNVPNTYIALTFRDALFRLFVANGTGYSFINETEPYMKEVLKPGEGLVNAPLFYDGYVWIENISDYVSATIWKDSGTVTPPVLLRGIRFYLGEPYGIAGYVLPNLGGFNVSENKIEITGLPMSTFYRCESDWCLNATLGINLTKTAWWLAIGKYTFNVVPYYPYLNNYVNITHEKLVTPDEYEIKEASRVVSDRYRVTVYLPSSLKTVNVTLTFEVDDDYIDYRLVRAMLEVSDKAIIKEAFINIYMTYELVGKKYKVKIAEYNVTDLFLEAKDLRRRIPIMLWINYSKVTELLPKDADFKSYVIEYLVKGKRDKEYFSLVSPPDVELIYRYTGKKVGLYNWTVLSTGFGGAVDLVNDVKVYRNGLDKDVDVDRLVRITPDEFWINTFGSPLLVLIPVSPEGKAVFSVPSWTLTTGAWGTRIMRVWVLGTEETPNVGYGEIKAIYVPEYKDVLPKYSIESYAVLNYVEPKDELKKSYVAIFTSMAIPVGTYAKITRSAVVETGGDYDLNAVGALTGGTSTLMLMFDKVVPVNIFNITKPMTVTLRTVALSNIEVKLDEDYTIPIVVTGFEIRTPKEYDTEYQVSIETPVKIEPGEEKVISVKYVYGSSYLVDAYIRGYGWCDIVRYEPYLPEVAVKFKYYPPNFTYYLPTGEARTVTSEELLKYLHEMKYAILADTLYSVSTADEPKANVRIPQYVHLYFVRNTTQVGIYHTDWTFYQKGYCIPLDEKDIYGTVGPAIFGCTYKVSFVMTIPFRANITTYVLYPYSDGEYAYWMTGGMYYDKLVRSGDHVGRIVILGEVLPVQELLDWNVRPLANQTIVAYRKLDNGTYVPIAITFTRSDGGLMSMLPAYSVVRFKVSRITPAVPTPIPLPGFTITMTPVERVATYWYNSYILRLLGTLATPLIGIYDSEVITDVEQLGNVRTSSTIRSWVYGMTVVVTTAEGRPVSGLLVVVKDKATNGLYFYASGITGSDGSVTLIDPRVSTVFSQAPATEYVVEVYKIIDTVLIPVMAGTMRVSRGATVPEHVEHIELAGVYAPVSVKVMAAVPGVTVGVTAFGQPAAGAELVIGAEEYGIGYTVGYRGLIVPKYEEMADPTKWKKVTVLAPARYTVPSDGIVTTEPIYLSLLGGAKVTINVVSWKRIPLGYTYEYTLTPTNVTTPIQIKIPATKVVVTALSSTGAVLGEIATINMTCGEYSTAGVGKIEDVIPIPKEGTIACTIVGTAAGVVGTTSVTLSTADVEKVREIKLTIPVAGWYIPGLGFIPLSEIILIIVVLIIVIIIIVIGLIEYSQWRRRKLAALLGPPR